ncbi:MAG: phosphopantetheine-binding protein [Oscillospiraceae bacterium]|nr:phosphopantetheine-binding protein [Oscillospiraceae bacterium]
MLDKIRKILCEFVDMEPDQITLDTDIHSDLALNSLELVNFAVEVEEEFDVVIPDKEAMGIRTVGDVIKIVEKYMNK